uniref:Uncharacterized protein n=1 Tax=Rangifer tarandus platyrhynchus TaxID=3082113 RepID=A0ACB0F320_RANTA|nr:unnamed protein product [Rangifer tarandus platyrhynchus]
MAERDGNPAHTIVILDTLNLPFCAVKLILLLFLELMRKYQLRAMMYRPRKIPLRTTMHFHVDALEPEELACLEKTKDKDRKIESLEKICLGAVNSCYSGLREAEGRNPGNQGLQDLAQLQANKVSNRTKKPKEEVSEPPLDTVHPPKPEPSGGGNSPAARDGGHGRGESPPPPFRPLRWSPPFVWPPPPAWLTPQLLPRSKDHLASAPLMMLLCSLVDPALPRTAQLCLRAEWASQEAKATVNWLPLGLPSFSLPTCSHSRPRRRKTARPDLLACSSWSGGGWTLRGDGR